MFLSTVEWTHESQTISADSADHQLSSSSAREHKLTIGTVREKDIGQYTVRLTDKTGTTVLTFSLNLVKE